MDVDEARLREIERRLAFWPKFLYGFGFGTVVLRRADSAQASRVGKEGVKNMAEKQAGRQDAVEESVPQLTVDPVIRNSRWPVMQTMVYLRIGPEVIWRAHIIIPGSSSPREFENVLNATIDELCRRFGALPSNISLPIRLGANWQKGVYRP